MTLDFSGPFFAGEDVQVYREPDTASEVIGQISKGSYVSFMVAVNSDGWAKVEDAITDDGIISGYVLFAQLCTADKLNQQQQPEPEATPEPEPEYTFEDCNETVYATGNVNLRNGPSTDFAKVGSLSKGDSATRIGKGDASGWSKVQLADGTIVYVSNSYLSTTKPTQNNGSTGSSSSKSDKGTQQQSSQQSKGDSSSKSDKGTQQSSQQSKGDSSSKSGGEKTATDEEIEDFQKALQEAMKRDGTYRDDSEAPRSSATITNPRLEFESPEKIV